MKKILSMIVALTTVISACTLSGCEKKDVASGDVPTLIWYVPTENSEDVPLITEAVNKITEEKIGAKVEFVCIDSGAYQEKMTMVMISGEEYDLCFTSSWMNDYAQNATKGSYANVTELMEEYAPGLKGAIPDYVWETSKIDGINYAVPNIQISCTQRTIGFLKNYVEKYNFDVSKVKTIDDVEEYWKIIKENEPEMYPYEANGEIFQDVVFENVAEGIAIRQNDPEATVVIKAETQEFKDGLKKMRDWFQKGYIREDVATLTGDTTDFYAGKYATFASTWKPGAEAEMESNLKQPVVFAKLNDPYLSHDAGMGTMTAISLTSKNPDKAIKLLELVNTDAELANIIYYGIEGKHYKKDADGKVEKITDAGYSYIPAWQIGNQFLAYPLTTQESDVWEQTIKLNEESKKSVISGFIFDNKNVKNEISSVAAVNNEYKYILLGAVDPDEVYEEYITKLKSAGIDKIKTEVERQLSEFKK